MKVYLENGVVCAKAETLSDVQRLFSMQVANTPTVGLEVASRPRHYKKECDVCGKKFKNLKNHKMMKHEGKHWKIIHNLPAIQNGVWGGVNHN